MNLNSIRSFGRKTNRDVTLGYDDDETDPLVCSSCGGPLIVRAGTSISCPDPDCSDFKQTR